MTVQRHSVVDFTFPVSLNCQRILAGRGKPEIDSWSFLFPFTKVVWVAIILALIGIIIVMILLSWYNPSSSVPATRTQINIVNSIRILLHQGKAYLLNHQSIVAESTMHFKNRVTSFLGNKLAECLIWLIFCLL